LFIGDGTQDSGLKPVAPRLFDALPPDQGIDFPEYCSELIEFCHPSKYRTFSGIVQPLCPESFSLGKSEPPRPLLVGEASIAMYKYRVVVP
jgi:hypothetical protein